MKAILRVFCALGIAFFITRNAGAETADTNGFHLTVELQDGSRLIGKAADESYQFKSDVFGEIKLPLEKIRSIECQPKTNLVNLITSTGDRLTVQFATKEIHLNTVFGSVKLPANILKQIHVLSLNNSLKKRLGLVALWSGEDNGNDSAGNNDAALTDVSFADGQVGQAFSFNGSSYASVADSPSLDNFTNGITIEAWIKANQTSANSDWVGIVTKGNSSWRLMGTPEGKAIYFAGTGLSKDLAGNRNVNDGQWHHVAAVYDGTNIFLYVDGTLDASTPSTGLISQNNYPMGIGYDAQGAFGSPAYFYNGSVDEVSVYHRALSAEEIKDIAMEENNGEPLPPPTPNNLGPRFFNGINYDFRGQ